MNRFRHIVLSLPLLLAGTLGVVRAERVPDYANDLGPATIDVSNYPADLQQGYKLMEAKCMRCHTVARVVNSEIVNAKDWARYMNRMSLRPPCCNQCPVITRYDAKAIYQFLVYDSTIRKTGVRSASWEAFRKQLLNDYQQKYPKPYAQRYMKTTPRKDQP